MSNDGQWLATAGYRVYADPIDEEFDMDDKSQDIKVWDLEGNLIKTMQGHTNSILSLAFSPDNKWLLSGSKDGTARLWSMDNGSTENEPALTLSIHDGRVAAVAFAPDGKSFLTAGADSTARLWTLTGDSIAVFRGHDDWLTAAIFTSDGKHVLTGSYDQTVRRWSISQPDAAPEVFQGHTAAVTALASSPDGRFFLSGGEDNSARLWNDRGVPQIELKQVDQNISGYGAILSLAFSRDGSLFVLGGSDGTAHVYQSDGNLVQTLKITGKGLVSTGFSNNDQYIMTAGEDGFARLIYQPEGFLETDLIAPLDIK
jgi:WD40 repeat protein